MDTQLVDRIYESCFAPETWPDVLDEIGRIADTAGASLFVSKDNVMHCVASPEPRQRAEKIVKEGWLWRGTIIGRLFAQRHAGFLIDVEFFTPEELDSEPIYRDVWRFLSFDAADDDAVVQWTEFHGFHSRLASRCRPSG
jgi:hypothetical protein